MLWFTLVVGSCILQAPQNLDDLEIAKVKAYLKLPILRESLVITMVNEKGERSTFRKKSLLKGQRCRIDYELPDGQKALDISDGLKTWSVMHANKTYLEAKVLTERSSWNPVENPVKVEENSFKMETQGPLPVLFAARPNPKIESIETVKVGDAQLRKVVATFVKAKGNTLTVTQWFLPDSWILKLFTVKGKGDTGAIDITGEATVQDFNAELSDSEFVLDPTLVTGYRKIDGNLLRGEWWNNLKSIELAILA